MRINIPLRLIGDENDPAHVVIELSGSIEFSGTSGWIEGVTLRRPRIVSDTEKTGETIRVVNGGKFDMAHCVLDNEGYFGSVSLITNCSQCRWEDVDVRGSSPEGCGIFIEDKSFAELVQVSYITFGARINLTKDEVCRIAQSVLCLPSPVSGEQQSWRWYTLQEQLTYHSSRLSCRIQFSSRCVSFLSKQLRHESHNSEK